MGKTKDSTKVSRRTAEDRRRLFVSAYISNGRNASQAAISAGYAASGAKQEGSRLLARADVREAIEKATQRVEEKATTKAAEVLDELRHVALARLSRCFKVAPDGTTISVLPIEEWTEHERAALSDVDVEAIFEGRGDEKQHVGNILKLKMRGKFDALSTLAKHHGLLKDVVEHRGTVYVIDPYASPAEGAPAPGSPPTAPADGRAPAKGRA